MSNPDDYAKWLQRAKTLLNITQRGAKKDLKESSNAIAKLLNDFKAKYGPQLAKYEKRFESLALETRLLVSHKAKFPIEQMNAKLAKLQREIELDIGSQDPVATPEIKQKVLDSTRWKPVYDDKCDRIGAAVTELEALPATGEHVGKLKDLLAAGKNFEPDFEAAYEALAGLSGTLKSGLEAAAKFDKEVGGKAFQDVLAKARKAVDEFDLHCGVGQPAAVVQHRATITNALREIAAREGDERKQQIVTATKMLGELQIKLGKEVEKAKSDAESIRKRLDAVSLDIGRLRLAAPLDVLAPRLAEYRGAAALAGQQKLADAGNALLLIEGPIGKEASTHEELRKGWIELEKTVQPLAEAAAEYVGGTPPDTEPERWTCCRSLLNAWNGIRNGDAAARQFEKAINAANALKLADAFTAANKGGKIAYPNPATELEVKVALERQRVDKGIQGVEATLSRLTEYGGDRKPYDLERTKQLEEFRKQVQATLASPTEKIEEALKKLHEAGDAVIQALTVDLLKDADAQKLKGVGKVEPNDEVKGLLRDAADALRYLGGYGVPADKPPISDDPALASLQSTLAKARIDASNGVDTAATLKKLLEDARDKRTTIEQGLQVRRKKAQEDAAKILESNATLRKGQHKRYAPFFDALASDVEVARLMTQGTVITVLAEGEQRLQQLTKALQSHALEFGKKDGTNFAKVEAEYERLVKVVDLDDHKTYQPVLRKTLQAELEKGLKPSLATLSPADALKALKDFETVRLKLLVDGAKATKERSEGLATAIADARKELQPLEKLSPVPEALVASLKQRLDAAAKRPKSAAGDAWLEVDSIRVLIATAMMSKDKAAELDTRVKMAAFNGEREKAEFEAAIDVFRKNTQRQVAELRTQVGRSESNEDLYDQIGVALKDAEKEAKAGNVALAREKLRIAEATAAAYRQNPYGAAGVGRRALAGAEKNWVTVAAEFRKQVDDLIAKVRGLQSEGDFLTAGGPQVIIALEPLQVLFNPQLFGSYVEPLSKAPPTEGTELGKRRLLKESGLLAVRRYQKVLADNVLIPVARDNPFGVAFPMQRVAAALRGLEGALVAC